MKKNIKTISRYLVSVLSIMWLTGCSSIPTRNTELTDSYKLLAADSTTNTPPIKSIYADMADIVFNTKNNTNTMSYAAVLETGDDALLVRIHLIRAARRTIDIQTFIWKQDKTSDFIFAELLQAAKRGVHIRLLIDALNPITNSKQLARMATAHKNLDICLYRPISEAVNDNTVKALSSFVFKIRRYNRRMHNKTFIVDGKIGISGGRNYEGKYFDRGSNNEFIFKDRDILVISQTVTNMTVAFDKFWHNKKSVNLLQFKDVQKSLGDVKNSPWKFKYPDDKYAVKSITELADNYRLSDIRPELKLQNIKSVTFVSDTPAKFDIIKPKHEMIKLTAEIIPSTEKYILLQTPYLIYSKKSLKEIKKRRKKNPKLKVIFSSNSLAAADHVNVYALSFKNRKKLYKKMGLDIYELKPYPQDIEYFVPRYKHLLKVPENKFREYLADHSIDDLRKSGPNLSIHAKTMVIDDKIALIGSYNFDPRSRDLNTECGFLIKDRDFSINVAANIIKMIEADNSWVVGKKQEKEPLISKFSGMIGSISSALPIFDIWPYTYTSVFELRKGGTPMLSRDPDFYKNYKDVGQFPDVKGVTTEIQTKLFKAFGGWSNCLM